MLCIYLAQPLKLLCKVVEFLFTSLEQCTCSVGKQEVNISVSAFMAFIHTLFILLVKFVGKSG